MAARINPPFPRTINAWTATASSSNSCLLALAAMPNADGTIWRRRRSRVARESARPRACRRSRTRRWIAASGPHSSAGVRRPVGNARPGHVCRRYGDGEHRSQGGPADHDRADSSGQPPRRSRPTTLSSAPGCRLGGRSRVGRRAFLGLGVTIVSGRTVGDDAMVWAGAVVAADVAVSGTVAGVPARPIQPHS